MAIARKLKLITFDGDKTLYSDGDNFAKDSDLLESIVMLLEHNINVAVVTAAGYQNAPDRYEQRLSGLLQGMREAKLTKGQMDKFIVLGGM